MGISALFGGDSHHFLHTSLRQDRINREISCSFKALCDKVFMIIVKRFEQLKFWSIEGETYEFPD